MPLKFKAGDQVAQVVKPIVGVVKAPTIIDNEIGFVVEWSDEHGTHERVFTEDQIEAAGPAPASA